MAIKGMRPAIAVIVGIGLLTFLYSKSQGVDPDRYSQTINQLRELKRLIPNVRQNILMVHIGKLSNYDPLATNLVEIQTGIDALKKDGSGIHESKHRNISLSVDEFADLAAYLSELVDDFKTSHSVYKNSSAYLPYITSEILDRLEKEKASNSLITHVTELRLALLQYQLVGSFATKRRLAEHIDGLELTSTHASAELSERIGHLRKHLNIVLAHKEKLHLNLEEIFALPIENSIDTIFKHYSLYFEELQSNAQKFQAALYTLSLLLLIYVAYVFFALRRAAVALRRANETLEERVEERTSDLQKSNQRLELEITERIEAEDALRQTQQSLENEILERRDHEERLEAQAAEVIAVAEELSLAEEKMKFLANHDALTGLPSLRLCKDRIETAMAVARREKSFCALMFIDLDGFKAVNDTLGHEAGDEVLKIVATRIQSSLREIDTAARVGGDEFIVVLPGITDPNDAAHLAERLIKVLSDGFSVNGGVAKIGASIGIALFPNDGETPDTLMRSADQSMYEIKRKGKNNYGFASSVLSQ